MHAGTEVSDALREAARAALSEARAAATDPARPEDEAVHDFRKAMKRWRAILRLLEPFLGDEGLRLRTEARDLARDLAGARDARVAFDALADLAKVDSLPPLSPRTLATITARLQELQAHAEGTSVTPEARARADAILAAACESLKFWPLARIDFRDLAEALAVHYRRARDAIPDDWASAAPETLHGLRQRVVTHRYQAEIVVPLWPRFGEFWVAEAQRLRDRLGQHQDLIVLTGLTAPHGPLAPWRSRLLPLIAARRAAHVAAAARLAGRLFADPPKAYRRRLIALWEHRVRTTA